MAALTRLRLIGTPGGLYRAFNRIPVADFSAKSKDFNINANTKVFDFNAKSKAFNFISRIGH